MASKPDFQKICRICLHERWDLESVFQDQIAWKLNNCFSSLSVHENDGLPENVCNACKSEVDFVWKFKTKCEDAESQLKTYLAEEMDSTKKELVEVKESHRLNIKQELDPNTVPESPAFVYAEFLDEGVDDRASSVESEPEVKPMCLQPRRRGRPRKDPALKKRKVKQGNPKDGPFVCRRCKCRFAIQSSLEKHMEAPRCKDAAFPCPDCDLYFVTRKTLIKHKVTHSDDRIQCDWCDKSFQRRDKLRAHQWKKHERLMSQLMSLVNWKKEDKKPPMSLPPPAPSQTLAERNEAEQKLRAFPFPVREPPSKFDCPKCGARFAQEKSLNQHLSVTDCAAAGNYTCIICSMSYGSKKSLKRHMLEHGAKETRDGLDGADQLPEEVASFVKDVNQFLEEEHQCGDCGARFAQEKSLALHREKGMCGQLQFICPICSLVYSRRTTLAKHMKRHSSRFVHACQFCSKRFSSPETLAAHERNHATLWRAMECHHCGRHFYKKDKLEAHVNTHRVEPIRYNCDRCEKNFASPEYLRRHVLYVHDQVKEHLCSHCGKGFSQKHEFLQHQMRHMGFKPLVCNFCGHGCVSKNEMKNHLRTHTGEKPHACDFCDARFARSDSLAKHRRAHTGERPYPCDMCPMRFIRLEGLKNHRRTHTGEKPFACPICDRRFTQKADMKKHEKTHGGANATNSACVIPPVAFVKAPAQQDQSTEVIHIVKAPDETGQQVRIVSLPPDWYQVKTEASLQLS